MLRASRDGKTSPKGQQDLLDTSLSFRRANLNLSSVYGPSLDLSELKQAATQNVNAELARAASNRHGLIKVSPLNGADKKINKTGAKAQD